jgi:hypothetical protein
MQGIARGTQAPGEQTDERVRLPEVRRCRLAHRRNRQREGNDGDDGYGDAQLCTRGDFSANPRYRTPSAPNS